MTRVVASPIFFLHIHGANPEMFTEEEQLGSKSSYQVQHFLAYGLKFSHWYERGSLLTNYRRRTSYYSM